MPQTRLAKSTWRSVAVDVCGARKRRRLAFVQVKSKTTSAELAEYVAQLDQHDSYDWMFYVFHSGKAETDDERVIVIGPDRLAEMVVDAGLVNWLVRKVS